MKLAQTPCSAFNSWFLPAASCCTAVNRPNNSWDLDTLEWGQLFYTSLICTVVKSAPFQNTIKWHYVKWGAFGARRINTHPVNVSTTPTQNDRESSGLAPAFIVNYSAQGSLTHFSTTKGSHMNGHVNRDHPKFLLEEGPAALGSGTATVTPSAALASRITETFQALHELHTARFLQVIHQDDRHTSHKFCCQKHLQKMGAGGPWSQHIQLQPLSALHTARRALQHKHKKCTWSLNKLPCKFIHKTQPAILTSTENINFRWLLRNSHGNDNLWKCF